MSFSPQDDYGDSSYLLRDIARPQVTPLLKDRS
jgi:hypothetical protein